MTRLRASYDHDLDRYRIIGDHTADPTVRVDLELTVTAWFTLTGELAELAIHSADRSADDVLGFGLLGADTRRIVDTLCGSGTLELLLNRHRGALAGPAGFVDLGELHVPYDALEQQRQAAATAWADSNPGASTETEDGAQSELTQAGSAIASHAVTVWSDDDLTTTVDAVEQGTGTVDEQPGDARTGQLVRLGLARVHLTDAIPGGLDLTAPAQITWQPGSGQLDIEITRRGAHIRIPDGWWVRISTDAGTTLAVAPLDPAGGAHTLLVTDDDTLGDAIIDLTTDPTRSVGGSQDRIRSRLKKLAAIAHDAEHDNDSAAATHAWQAAAHIAADHGDDELAERLRSRARQHHHDASRPHRARNVEPEDSGDAMASERRQTLQRLVITVVVAAVVAAVVVWALTRSGDGTDASDQTAVSAPVDVEATEPDTTEPATIVPTTNAPVAVVNNVTAEYIGGDPTPFTGILERIELTVQTPTLTADQPLQVLVTYVRTTPGDPWAPGQSLANCLGNVGRALPVDVDSPDTPSAQLTTSYRAAPIQNGTDDLDQYNQADGEWVPLTVTTPVSQLVTVATSSTVTGCRLENAPPDQRPELADQVQVAYQLPHQPTTVSIDVAALDPGTYTLVPVLMNGIPTTVNPGLVTFTITSR